MKLKLPGCGWWQVEASNFTLSSGASKKTLTAQLRELENDGIISRKVIPTVPAA